MLVYDLLQYFPLYETSRPIRAVAQWDMIRTGIGADAKYFVDAPSFHETKTFTVISFMWMHFCGIQGILGLC